MDTNNTPLNVDKIISSASVESTTKRHELPTIFTKYNIILAISVLALLAGGSFWFFVTFML